MPINLTTSISGAAPTGDVYFGALTLAGAGAISAPSGATSITDAGGTNLALSSGSVSPATAGVASGTVTFDSGDTWTVVAEANTYSAASNAEASAALNAIGAAGGKTVKLRPGNYTGARGALTKNRTFSAETILYGYDKDTVIFGETWLENCTNLTIENVTCYVASGTQMQFYGTDRCTVRNCIIYGPTIDPEGDYSAASPIAAAGVALSTGASGNISPTITGNIIHDVDIGIRFGSGVASGDVRINGNSVYNCYEDCIKVGGGPTTLHVKDNYLAGVIANGNDFGNPHADFMQFLGSSADWTGIEIDRNIIVALYSRAAAQGVFMDDMAAGFYYTGVKARGNLVVQNGGSTTGIRIRQAKDCEVYGNTVVSNLTFGATGPGIAVGDAATAGAHIVKNNAADNVSITGTSTTTNNVTLGAGGAQVAYGTAFSGTGFNPTTRAEALSMFAMKANGPLDVDNSGGASAGDVGAVGSGYVTFPENPSTTAGTCDAAYE